MQSLRNPNRKPTHPGAILREDVLPEMNIKAPQLALKLGVSAPTVYELLKENRSVTAEMAVRLSKVVGGTPESWLRMQDALDIWKANNKFKRNPALGPVRYAKAA